MSKKKSTLFNYTDWLKNIKIGDEILSPNLSTVIGITNDHIIIDTGKNIVTFCKNIGRELGSRSGQYKDRQLKPYTDEAREEEERKKQEEEERQAKRKLASKAVVAFCGGTISHYSTESIINDWPTPKIEAFIEVITDFHEQSFTKTKRSR